MNLIKHQWAQSVFFCCNWFKPGSLIVIYRAECSQSRACWQSPVIVDTYSISDIHRSIPQTICKIPQIFTAIDLRSTWSDVLWIKWLQLKYFNMDWIIWRCMHRASSYNSLWTNKMHKILVIRLYFLLDALQVSDCISPPPGATL